MYAIVAVVVLWSALQVAELSEREKAGEPADKMLYQVAYFQMELLGSHLAESARARDTDQLNALRQAVYSASYTHEHLVKVYGKERLARLESLSGLLQYLLRLQVGGTRPLKAEEQAMLAEASKRYAGLFEAYGKLMNDGGRVIGSQNSALKAADTAFAALLDRKQQP